MSQQWASFLRNREGQVFLVLTLLIGALVGMVVVAFILVTERFGATLYPAGGAACGGCLCLLQVPLAWAT